MYFGSLGFLGDATPNARQVVLGGGFNHAISTLSDQNILSGFFGYNRTDAATIAANFKDYFNSNGWNILSFNVSPGNTDQYGFTVTLNAYDEFSAEQLRQNMLTMFQAYTSQGFSNFFVQIIQDNNLNAGAVISDINTQQIASTPQSTGGIVSTGITNTVSQVSTDGLAKTTAKGLSTILFGAGNENLNIFGTSVNKVVLIGGLAGALLLADTLSKRK